MNKNWRRTFAVIYAGQAFSLLGSSAVQFAVIWRLTARTESALTLTAAACPACPEGARRRAPSRTCGRGFGLCGRTGPSWRCSRR